MECRNIFSPTTSQSSNPRKRRLKSPSRASYSEDDSEGTTFNDPEVQAAQNSSRQPPGVYEEAPPHAYITEVARRYAERMRKMKERSLERSDLDHSSTSLSLIKQRLRRLIGECDIERMSCCVPMCGRVFNTIQVLAWHMSYSHHDLALKSTYGNLCFVCGVRMDSAKGKTIHLTSKHKDLCLMHNDQCIHQRLPVISPHAPAAMRILQFANDREVEEEDTYEDVPFHGYERDSPQLEEVEGCVDVPYEMNA
ncbi:hypothetical protein Q1695_015958 [Nippostrongylus brasiliensis]|nr:hypothetical protein Q1695_015958 [Nippostrongylus brasiliensis]